ncbi:MAG: VanZ family protein [bacterium]|jgi:hypothetical protein
MSRHWRWTITGIYLLSLPFMRRAWEMTGGKSPFLSNTVPLATGVALLFAILWYLVRNKRESRASVWLAIAAVCAAYAVMFRALPQQIERVHLAQYALLSMLVFWAMENGDAGYGLAVWAALVTVELGFADECFQGLIPSRIYDINDVLLNAKAALMGQAIVVFVLRPWETPGRRIGAVDDCAAYPRGVLLWCALVCIILLVAVNAYILDLGTPTFAQDALRDFSHRDGFRYFGGSAILLNAAVLAAASSIVALMRRHASVRVQTAVLCGLLSSLVLLVGRLMGLHFR